MVDGDGTSVRTQEAAMVLRCECGVIINANGSADLIGRTRSHYETAHPDLGSDIPADLILAMAEEEVQL
jgi:hypothetical protein